MLLLNYLERERANSTPDLYSVSTPKRARSPQEEFTSVEVLFIQIRENNDIHGIKIGDHEIKLSAYADNADFLTSDTQKFQHMCNVSVVLFTKT